MASVLDDHRRVARRTVVVMAALIALMVVAFAVFGRARAIPGLLAGGALGVFDILLLARAVSRFGRSTRPLGGGALTGALLSRFAMVGALLGLLMAARGMLPLAVIAGFLTLPVGLVSVGWASIRRKPGAGGARRRHFAR